MDETLEPTPTGPRTPPSGFPAVTPGSQGFTLAKGERFSPGTLLLGRYRLISRLGIGGMGEVYRADDLTLGTSVALKFLPTSATHDPLRRQKLLEEVRLAREVTHPNVCRVFDIAEYTPDTGASQLFITMEYVDGEDLASLLRRIGRFSEDRAVEISRQICYGLAAAHEKGILHRDLKPANIMLDGRGKIRITDFGLAALGESLSTDEARAGTPAYMSPEQRRGDALTPRSDIYALGLVLHEIFTGKSALTGDTITQLTRSASTTSSRLSTHFKNIDPQIERIIDRCLEPLPADRPSSAIAVASQLPGADALAAAIAAGEMPSPQLVAESGGRGRLSPKIGACLLTFFLLVLGYRVLAYESIGLHRVSTMAKSPEVLLDRARSLVQKFAPGAQRTDFHTSLTRHPGFVGHLFLESGTAESIKRLSADLPGTYRFFYRQSPSYLVAAPIEDSVNDEQPPREPGDIQLELSMAGRLTRFIAAPAKQFNPPATQPATQSATQPATLPATLPAPTTTPAPFDFTALFTEAGLDLNQFRTTDPAWDGAPVAADARLAWIGKLPEPEPFPIRIEAGLSRGHLAYFTILEPWDLPRSLRAEMGYQMPTMPPANRWETTLKSVLTNAKELAALIFILLYTFAFSYSFANLGRGRGDLRGGLRLATITCVGLVGAWVLGVHHPLSTTAIAQIPYGMARPLVQSLYIFVVYIALEPFIRASWPERLVSWSRLIDGRFRDPMVARDALIGLAGGAALYLSVQGFLRFAPLLNYRLSPVEIGNMDQLLSIPRTLAFVLSLLCYTVHLALMSVFVLVLLRKLLRKTWLAVTIFVPLWACIAASQYGLPGAALQITSDLLYASVVATLIVRLGLLSNTVALATLSLLLVLPSTTTTESYWFPSFAVLMLLYIAFAILTFKRATQPALT